MNIEMRHLRYFVAVAEEAGFTAAAQRVHVTQQVLSTQIRQLEDAVGVELPGCAQANSYRGWRHTCWL